MSERKTVWILGSGFSKGLGGPLLYELLSERGKAETGHLFPGMPDRSQVYRVFRQYGPESGARYWQHAEEFLDFVDTAALERDETNPRKRFLREVVDFYDKEMTLERFRDLAILAIAAECSPHVELGSLASESWQPYLRWARRRRDTDAIVTFNYDEVLEALSRDGKVRRLSRESVVRPFGTSKVPDGACPVYKLHGSVKWAFDERNVREPFKEFGDLAGFTLDNGYRPLIATPGITKRSQCDGPLSRIWREAMGEVREAAVVVFLGYRFPPSDSLARTSLLAAIQQNETPYLRVHTVLGPNVHHEHTVRLGAMLEHVLRGKGRVDKGEPLHSGRNDGQMTYNVIHQPLYVEDFLSILNLEMLFGKRYDGTEYPDEEAGSSEES